VKILKSKSLVFEGSTTQNPFGSTPGKVRFLKINLFHVPYIDPVVDENNPADSDV
jgi:hypothetical protein